jgi:hypothetical protein
MLIRDIMSCIKKRLNKRFLQLAFLLCLISFITLAIIIVWILFNTTELSFTIEYLTKDRRTYPDTKSPPILVIINPLLSQGTRCPIYSNRNEK